MKSTKVISLISGIFLAVVFGMIPYVQAQSCPTGGCSITVDVNNVKGPVNRGVLSSAMLGYPDYHHVDGDGVWDPDNYRPVPRFVNYAQEIDMKYYRYTMGYWKHAVGPVDERPAIYGHSSNEGIAFGLPEYLKFADDDGAESILLIVYDVWTVQDAEDLVEYLNVSCDQPECEQPDQTTCSNAYSQGNWPLVRVCDRQALGYAGDSNMTWDIELFEFGNETYLIGDHLAGEYSNNYITYQDAMKAVNDSVNIKLGAVLTNFSGILNEWNVEVIQKTGSLVDFYIHHVYIPTYRDNCCDMNDLVCQEDETKCVMDETILNDLFAKGLAGVNGQVENHYKQFNFMIYELSGRNDIPIAVTEFNGGFIQNEPLPYRHTLGNALINSELVRQFMHADNILMSNNWHFGSGFMGIANDYTERPNYHVFRFYNHMFGSTLLDAQVQSGTYEVTSGEYGVEPAVCYYPPECEPIEESLDSVDLLNGKVWPDVHIGDADAEYLNGVYTITFNGPDIDYADSVVTVSNAVIGEWYRLSGYIKAGDPEDPLKALTSSEGVYLAVQDGVNFIFNNSFENDFTDWSRWSDPAGASTTIDSGNFFLGTKSANVYFDGSANVNYYHTMQSNIAVDPLSTYLVEGYIKADLIDLNNSNEGAFLSINDMRSWKLGSWSTPKLLDTEGEWVHVSEQFNTKLDTSDIKLSLNRVGNGGIISGNAWWDDVKLTKGRTIDIRGTSEIQNGKFVYIDFMADSSTIDVSLKRNSGGGNITGTASIKDVKLRKLTQTSNGNVPYLSVNASKSADGKIVYLMVVNKNLTDPVTAPINLVNFVPSSAQARILKGDSIDACKDVDAGCDPGKNVYVESNNMGLVQNGFDFTFPKHSLTALEINSCSDSTGYTLPGEPCSWQFRQEITVSADMTDNDLYDFPLLIKIADENNILFDNAHSEGDDIVFTLSDGTKLDHEIEKYNTSEGSKELVSWVRIPVLFSNVDTIIFMYYGNDGTTSQQKPSGVWDSNYIMVQHLQDSPDDDLEVHVDSTNLNDCTPKNFQNGGDGSTDAAGQIGGADDFDGLIDQKDYADCGDGANLNFNGSFTVEAWFNPEIWNDGVSESKTIVNKYDYDASGTRGWILTRAWTPGNGLEFSIFDGAGGQQRLNPGNIEQLKGSWIYAAGVFKAGEYLKLFIKSYATNEVHTLPAVWTSFAPASGYSLSIGKRSDTTNYFTGLIDEVRISDTPRSAEWIDASFRNQSAPDTYVVYGVLASDFDNDGLDYDFEILIGTDPYNDDTDSDGLTDYVEVCYDGDCNNYTPYPSGGDLNALSQDTDSDGILDGGENCPFTLPVKIDGSYYSTINNAYDSAINNDVIKSHKEELVEDLVLELDKTVTLDGGYNCSHTTKTGTTALNGSMIVIDGTVSIEDFVIE